MPALHEIEGARVTAVGDVNEGRARHVASRYGIEHVFADPQSLIRSGVANVIGVLVPPAAHLEVAAMAIEAGCHVLVEKPVALEMAHADKLVELASKHDVRVLMGFHMRWHRLIRRAREYVHSGALGVIDRPAGDVRGLRDLAADLTDGRVQFLGRRRDGVEAVACLHRRGRGRVGLLIALGRRRCHRLRRGFKLRRTGREQADQMADLALEFVCHAVQCRLVLRRSLNLEPFLIGLQPLGLGHSPLEHEQGAGHRAYLVASIGAGYVDR